MPGGIGLGEVFHVGAHEDQAAGAAFTVSGGDAGLGAADLAFEVIALAALGILELFFARLQLLLQGLLAGQQLLEFFLRPHGCRW